jgi:hypothetical protein
LEILRHDKRQVREKAMICVFVTFRFGDDFNAAKLQTIAEKARSKFEGLPGLRSKLFSIAPEAREARNVYVWNDPEAARAFFTPEMRDRITALYGVAPLIEYGEVAALVDNQA